ncbi:glucose-methanol-choline oxidoreductase, partial [Mycena latifolia]
FKSDFKIAIEGLKLAAEFVATLPWDGYIIEPFGVFADATTDEDITAYARTQDVAAYARPQVTSFWHPCCTAKMGTLADNTFVVDESLRLKGATDARIVDASVFVRSSKYHLQAPVYAVAERAADLIGSFWWYK